MVTALKDLIETRAPAVPDQLKTSVSAAPLTVPVIVTLPVGEPEAWTWSRLALDGCRAGVMLAGGVLCVSGLMHPVTQWLIVLGASVHVAQFTALSLSAILTGGQFVIAIFPLLFFVPLHIILAWEAAIYDPCGSP